VPAKSPATASGISTIGVSSLREAMKALGLLGAT
jgi:hypothetical protein